jgi:PPE-repeat protein
MWAQDAAAMYGYAANSATASQLSPFSAPQSTTTAGSVAGQASAAAQATNSSAAAATSSTGDASTLSGLASWLGLTPGSNTSTTGLAGLLNYLDGSNGSLLGSFLNNAAVANFSNAFTTSGLMNPTSMIDSATCFGYLFGAVGANGGLTSNLPGLAAGLVPGALGPAGLPGLGAAVSAGMGQAAPLGVLSVPQSWASAAPAFGKIASELPGASGLSSVLGATPLVAPNAPMGMPGMPLGGMAGLAAHQFEEEPLYGFRPIVIARPPAAG